MNCIEGNCQLLDQISSLLEKLNDQQYSQKLASFNGATIGQHFRHILDFYNCLIAGSEGGFLDYTRRERSPLIETDTAIAINRIEEIRKELERLAIQQVVTVQADFSKDPGAIRPVVGSTVGRELMFAYDHGIHHLAIIKMGVRLHFPEISIPQELGVAPSTLKHHNAKITS